MIRLTVDMGRPRTFTVMETGTGRVLGGVRGTPDGRWQLYVPDGDGEAPWSTPQDDPGWCALRATMRGRPLFGAMWEGGGIEIVADQATAAEGGHVSLVGRTRR